MLNDGDNDDDNVMINKLMMKMTIRKNDDKARWKLFDGLLDRSKL